MRKIFSTALTTTAVAAAAVALTALPASAAATSADVSLPGVSTATTPITGQNNGIVAAASSSGGVMTCADVGSTKALTAAGTVKVGTGLNPIGIGSVTNAGFNNCVVNNLPAVATAQNLPWRLDATDPSASGVTPGKLVGVKVKVDIPSIGCTATFQGPGGTDGEINGEHTDPASPGDPSQLSLPFGATNNLVATGVSGCPSNIVQNGDTATIAGLIDLTGDNATGNEGPTVVAS
ncbi:hypothetical protein [Actinomadura geliboluensis]